MAVLVVRALCVLIAVLHLAEPSLSKHLGQPGKTFYDVRTRQILNRVLRRSKRQTDEPQASPSQEYFSNTPQPFASQRAFAKSSVSSSSSGGSSGSAASKYLFPDRIRYASLTDPASTQLPTRPPKTTESSRRSGSRYGGYSGSLYRGGLPSSPKPYGGYSSPATYGRATQESNYYYGNERGYGGYQQPRQQPSYSPYNYGGGSYGRGSYGGGSYGGGSYGGSSYGSPYASAGGYGQSTYNSAYPAASSQQYPSTSYQGYQSGYGGQAAGGATDASGNPLSNGVYGQSAGGRTTYSGSDIRVGSSSTRYNPSSSGTPYNPSSSGTPYSSGYASYGSAWGSSSRSRDPYASAGAFGSAYGRNPSYSPSTAGRENYGSRSSSGSSYGSSRGVNSYMSPQGTTSSLGYYQPSFGSEHLPSRSSSQSSYGSQDNAYYRSMSGAYGGEAASPYSGRTASGYEGSQAGYGGLAGGTSYGGSSGRASGGYTGPVGGYGGGMSQLRSSNGRLGVQGTGSSYGGGGLAQSGLTSQYGNSGASSSSSGYGNSGMSRSSFGSAGSRSFYGGSSMSPMGSSYHSSNFGQSASSAPYDPSSLSSGSSRGSSFGSHAGAATSQGALAASFGGASQSRYSDTPQYLSSRGMSSVNDGDASASATESDGATYSNNEVYSGFPYQSSALPSQSSRSSVRQQGSYSDSVSGYRGSAAHQSMRGSADGDEASSIGGRSYQQGGTGDPSPNFSTYSESSYVYQNPGSSGNSLASQSSPATSYEGGAYQASQSSINGGGYANLFNPDSYNSIADGKETDAYPSGPSNTPTPSESHKASHFLGAEEANLPIRPLFSDSSPSSADSMNRNTSNIQSTYSSTSEGQAASQVGYVYAEAGNVYQPAGYGGTGVEIVSIPASEGSHSNDGASPATGVSSSAPSRGGEQINLPGGAQSNPFYQLPSRSRGRNRADRPQPGPTMSPPNAGRFVVTTTTAAIPNYDQTGNAVYEAGYSSDPYSYDDSDYNHEASPGSPEATAVQTGARGQQRGSSGPILVGAFGPEIEERARHNATSSRVGEHAEAAAVQRDQDKTKLLPDIQIDKRKLITHFFLDRKPLSSLLCARGAGCLSSSAQGSSRSSQRKLLRFQTTVHNIGEAPFLPALAKSDWLFHQCHNHSHSMEVFTHYDLLDRDRRKVAEGHKASFCLEDSSCRGRARKVYNCDRGHQGISAGCEDTYKASIDCQWIDVTDVHMGDYVFKVTINPDRLVPESNFENNGIECNVSIKRYTADIWRCKVVGV